MEDAFSTLINMASRADLDSLNKREDAVAQKLTNLKLPPSLLDAEELKKQGYVFNGFGWVKP